MQIYLVGGAVRDKLLGQPVKDNDWVVTGSTPEQMKQQGYIPVGKDFPVFLHPETKEEYALARTERKSGHGYAGFIFHTSPDVSIEEDLIRRDLTINAIAEDQKGNLIDPYHGQEDIQKKQLRHVSPAFQEDPLRILRVARFAARFKSHGFTVAEETMALMKTICVSGEASHLVAERVWQETIRALMESSPQVYFEILQNCNALPLILPEIHEFIQNSDNLAILHSAAQQNTNSLVRFGCLFAGAEEETERPLTSVKQMSERMRLPAAFGEIATMVIKYSEKIPDILEAGEAESLMSLYEQTDAIRRPERFTHLLACSGLINKGKISSSALLNTEFYLREIIAKNAKEIVLQGFKGKEIGLKLREDRIKILKKHDLQ